jgi:hypothetical protein
MDTDRIVKYNLIQIDCNTFEMKILHTTCQFNIALEFLNKYIADNFQLSNYLKCYHDNNNTTSIYKYHWIAPKELLFKFQIIQYIDDTPN